MQSVIVGPTGINGAVGTELESIVMGDPNADLEKHLRLDVTEEMQRTGLIEAQKLFDYMVQIAHAPTGLNNNQIIESLAVMRGSLELGREALFTPDDEVAMNFIILRNGPPQRWIDAGFTHFPVARVFDVFKLVQPWSARGESAGHPSGFYFTQSLCDAVQDNWPHLKESTKALVTDDPHCGMIVEENPDGTAREVWIG